MLMVSSPALAQNFQTDRVITAQEIEPAVEVMNEWNRKLYPTFALRYSSNPAATQAQGFIALKGANRLIALFVSKYLSTGAKSTQIVKGQFAVAGVADRVFDELRVASYAESGAFEYLSLGNLNDTPGSVLVGLVQGGAKLPGQATPQNCDAQVNTALDRVDAAVRGARP